MKMLFGLDDLSLVASYLRQGEVIAIPTETVYGLAANIHCPTAIARIFSLKNRPVHHPLIVHIASFDQLTEYTVHNPAYVAEIARVFWPGPLTFVLPKSPQVCEKITGSQDTVAIRMPSHPLTQQLIQLIGAPLAAPSANRFGHISPTLAEHVVAEFQGKVPVLDGGACGVGIESTILDATHPEHCTVLRPGMISVVDIQKVCAVNVYSGQGARQVSGSLPHHYAPTKPNYLFNTEKELMKIADLYENAIYLLRLSEKFAPFGLAGVHMPTEPQQYAQEFYKQLRIADLSSYKAIAIESPPQTMPWLGITDRLIKSTAKWQETLMQLEKALS